MATPRHSEKIDPVLYLIFGGMVFFTFVLIGVEHFFMQDAQVFQVVAGILTGFTGAFFARMKPPQQHSTGGDDNSVTLTQATGPKTAAPEPSPPQFK